MGSFPHWGVWAEWNGRFRDSVRQFIKGTDGFAGEFAERLCGSPEMYARGGRAPRHSINFITAHDGFTLGDLVQYNRKHNEANGEDNRDGEEHNLSWNCGDGEKHEGPTADAAVMELRRRQARNFLAALLLSQGVPMLHMGDEYGHSKGGNNNTYCHDSPLNYFVWSRAAAAAEAGAEGVAQKQERQEAASLMRFCSALVHFRHATPSLRLRAHPTGNQIAWHGVQPNQPDWSETSRLVAFTLNAADSPPLFIAFNASHVPAMLTLPDAGPGRRWKLLMDTALPPPFDIVATDIPAEIREARPRAPHPPSSPARRACRRAAGRAASDSLCDAAHAGARRRRRRSTPRCCAPACTWRRTEARCCCAASRSSHDRNVARVCSWTFFPLTVRRINRSSTS